MTQLKGSIPWNKGLTKQDHPSLMKAGNKISKSKKGQNPWNTGLTKETDERIRKQALSKVGKHYPKLSAAKSGENHHMYGIKSKDHPMWNRIKESASINKIHRFVERRKPKPDTCEECNNPPKRGLHLASNNGHKYTRNPKDYKWLCEKCHNKKDANNRKSKGG